MLEQLPLVCSWQYNKAAILPVYFLHSSPGTDNSVGWSEREVIQILMHWVARGFPTCKQSINALWQLKVNWYTFKGSSFFIFILASLLNGGLFQQEKICSCRSKFFSFRVNPNLKDQYCPGKQTGSQKSCLH